MNLKQEGKASVTLGGQWGSEGKGCAAAWIAAQEPNAFDVYTTNAGCQSGHTSLVDGVKRVVYHLPTAPLVRAQLFPGKVGVVYLNGGCVIEPMTLLNEYYEYGRVQDENCLCNLYIHPNAAVVDDDCRNTELMASSPMTAISSTRKGVGEALARKVRRSNVVAGSHAMLRPFIRRIDLNARMMRGESVLVEVPQGVSLSLTQSRFYPHVTSRDCTVTSALADAGIHPSFLGSVMMVLRTYPIRVGSLSAENNSGPCYPDQKEIEWGDIGVEPELTTVTKRVRRVFTWSQAQVCDSFALCRPDVVMLTFCNYVKSKQVLDAIVGSIYDAARICQMDDPVVLFQWGPDVTQIGTSYNV